jgi:hypothetical protein
MNRTFALAATLAAGIAMAPIAADAALLSISDGTPFSTPRSNDVIGSGHTLRDNATLGTTQSGVRLDYYFLGSESGFRNTVNTSFGSHTEVDNPPYPNSLPGTFLFGGTQAASGPVALNFTSSDFLGSLALGGGDAFKSIALGYLVDTVSFSISATPTNVVLFALDDSGAGADDDHDDYVGYVVATPIPPALPLLLTALAGIGLIGRRKMKAAAV